MSTTLVRIRFGSHLYGTGTPASDLDFKAVVIPPARDILLQRAQDTVSRHRVKEHGERNGPDDVDEDAFALHRYLALLAEGQTTALDMLFAPRWAMEREPTVQWKLIVANRERLVSRRAASFVGYCRTQANRYGIRGSRVHAVREVVAWFDAAIARHGPLACLQVAGDELPGLIAARALEHTAVVHIPHPSRPDPIPHLECCSRKAPFFATLKEARAIYARVLAEYGARALQAERNKGVDWKAVSYAVRVGREALAYTAMILSLQRQGCGEAGVDGLQPSTSAMHHCTTTPPRRSGDGSSTIAPLHRHNYSVVWPRQLQDCPGSRCLSLLSCGSRLRTIASKGAFRPSPKPSAV